MDSTDYVTASNSGGGPAISQGCSCVARKPHMLTRLAGPKLARGHLAGSRSYLFPHTAMLDGCVLGRDSPPLPPAVCICVCMSCILAALMRRQL
jgi:hypothetical protein